MNPFTGPLIWRRPVALAVAGVLTTVVILLALLWQLDPGATLAQAQAGTGVIWVTTSGSDTSGCGGAASPCATIQCAVDQAQPGDEIRGAAGAYTGVNGYGGLSQVVYIRKTVIIRGGYTPTNWSDPDPATNPTTSRRHGRSQYLCHLAGRRSITHKSFGPFSPAN